MGTPLRVLIIEDSEDDTLLITHELKRGGYDPKYERVETAGAMNDALNQQEWDIVISDHSMPHFNSFNALDVLKKRGLDLPFFLVSGSIDEEMAVSAMKAGVHDYIMKGNLKRLIPAIARELRDAVVRQDRKRKEEALRESEKRYRQVIENATEIIYSLNAKGNFTYGNPAGLKVTGFSLEELRQFNYQDLIVPEHRERLTRVYINQLRERQAATYVEFPFFNKSGEVVWFGQNASLLIEDGKVVGFHIIARDITERKKAEEALSESEQRYRNLIENAPDVIFTLASDGTITSLNPAFEKITGWPRSEWLNKHFVHIIYPDDLRRGLEFLQRALKGEKIAPFELKVFSKSRDYLTAEFTVTPQTQNGSVIGVLGISRDITERKRAEEEREKMQAQLIQAQKMESIGTLAGGVAHDFNNLLTTIQGYAQLAMMSLKESDPFYENFKEIQQASVRAAKLTRQLLLFSRQQPMDLHLMTLNETVDNLMKMLKRLIGEDITVQTDLDPNLWTNMADPGNMEQVIMNLVVNARDAMPEGKKITIKTENVDIDEGYCEIYKYAHPGKFVCLSVEDTGIGMDKEFIQHIFEPFFTTKGPGKGTGLGLSVVYGIVKQNEGWINVYSEPGRGSVFKVYLPASFVESKDETKEEVISIQDCHGKGERILLVEDDDGIREFAKRVLFESGYVGFEAANAEEALNIFGKEKEDFHLVFSDVVLPEKSGLQLVEQLLCRKPELKVLLTSGYTDQKSQWPVICEKGYRFIQKPYGLTDLLRVVREVIEQGK